MQGFWTTMKTNGMKLFGGRKGRGDSLGEELLQAKWVDRRKVMGQN